MSSIVSRRPSLRNQSKDSRWMSIRLGRSRTCLRREKEFRARGAVTVFANDNSLPYWLWNEGRRKKGEQKSDAYVRTRRRTPHDTEGSPRAASTRRGPGSRRGDSSTLREAAAAG